MALGRNHTAGPAWPSFASLACSPARPSRGPARLAPATTSLTRLPTRVKAIQPHRVNPVKQSRKNSGNHPLWIFFKNLACLIPFRDMVVRTPHHLWFDAKNLINSRVVAINFDLSRRTNPRFEFSLPSRINTAQANRTPRWAWGKDGDSIWLLLIVGWALEKRGIIDEAWRSGAAVVCRLSVTPLPVVPLGEFPALYWSCTMENTWGLVALACKTEDPASSCSMAMERRRVRCPAPPLLSNLISIIDHLTCGQK
jgi:hypothetical protein